jgi:uncharacterized protein
MLLVPKLFIAGGMTKRQEHEHITKFIDVKSVDEYSSKIQELGSRVVVPRMVVPGMGYFQFVMIQRNSFDIWESNENAR